MRIFYYRSHPENFGDVLNAWMWPKLINGIEEACRETLFLSIGTVLSAGILGDNIKDARDIVVFGSGAGYGALPVFDSRWRFIFVRGPRTAKVVGIESVPYITDPAILVQTLVKSTEKKFEVSYMPHHLSKSLFDWEQACRGCGMNFVDPGAGVTEVLEAIRASRLLITEAMHGAIVADALRVPWVPVACYEHILPFKWLDWADTVGLRYEPVRVRALWRDMEGASWVARGKTKTKRLCRAIGIWRKNWWPLPPAKSTDVEIEEAMEQMVVASRIEPQLSKDEICSKNLERVMAEVYALTRRMAGEL